MSRSRIGLLTALLLTLSGCSSMQYYSQSISGHWQVWWPQQPISDILADEQQSDEVKTQLALALRARQFASSRLALPDNDSYTGYTDLHRPYVVWNVVAAEEFSLTPKTWCYLVVGCVSYRGYFSAEQAQQLGKSLQQQGWDVSVGGVSAYSTLGWFDDPVLNTMLHWSERRLVELIFHELAHQVVYIAGETSFNEAFATAVARLGVVHWYQENGQDTTQYLRYLQQHADFRALLVTYKDHLAKLYASGESPEAMRQQKAAIFQELKQAHLQHKTQWAEPNAFDAWFARPLNNAMLASSMTYLENVPAFYALFAEVNGDWKRFYQQVKQLKGLSPKERQQQIETWLQRSVTLPEAMASAQRSI